VPHSDHGGPGLSSEQGRPRFDGPASAVPPAVPRPGKPVGAQGNSPAAEVVGNLKGIGVSVSWGPSQLIIRWDSSALTLRFREAECTATVKKSECPGFIEFCLGVRIRMSGRARGRQENSTQQENTGSTNIVLLFHEADEGKVQGLAQMLRSVPRTGADGGSGTIAGAAPGPRAAGGVARIPVGRPGSTLAAGTRRETSQPVPGHPVAGEPAASQSPPPPQPVRINAALAAWADDPDWIVLYPPRETQLLLLKPPDPQTRRSGRPPAAEPAAEPAADRPAAEKEVC
jgi:hypothetical protein